MTNPVYKVFINDTALCIINVYDAGDLKKADGKIISSTAEDVRDVIREIETDPASPVYYYLSDNPHTSWNILLSYYSHIEAAGGLVLNDKGEYLTIFRRGKWDLPKGKVEYDESPEQAAVREVEEECGVTGLTIMQPLTPLFHTYSLKKKSVLKKTYWYLMKCPGSQIPTPQIEEDIEKAQWMSAQQIKTLFFNDTYQSIRDFLIPIIK